jgi:hypothetical protein
MVRGKAVALRMLADITHPQRARLVDQNSEQPPSPWEIPDGPVRGRIDAASQEPLELDPVLIEYAEGGVAGVRDRASLLQDLGEYRLGVQFTNQGSADLQNAAELLRGIGRWRPSH